MEGKYKIGDIFRERESENIAIIVGRVLEWDEYWVDEYRKDGGISELLFTEYGIEKYYYKIEIEDV